eukprot:7247307-Prymnesium_polylepis.1
MYVHDERGHLVALTDREWYAASIRVYDGDFSVEDDKMNLVDTVVGLWAHALKARSIRPPARRLTETGGLEYAATYAKAKCS